MKVRLSPFRRMGGLGSAREGARHWWVQRSTAVALVPLTLWFVASLIAHSTNNYEAVVAWLRSPFSTTMTVLLLIAVFWHIALGLQVIAEDYIHNDFGKVATMAAIYFGSFALAVAGIVASLRLAFGT